MQKRTLGNTLEVSAIGLGCMGMSQSYGPPPGDRQEMIALHSHGRRARRHLLRHRPGLRPVHERGAGGRGAGARPRSGRDRHQVRLRRSAPTGEHAGLNSRPEHIRQMIEGSLTRLGTDVIDLYYQHRVDPDVPIEEVAGAVKDLIEEGKVKHFGLSEARRRRSAAPTRCSRSRPSRASTRCGGGDPEEEVLPTLEELGIGFVPFSPLGKGFLTGTIDETRDVRQQRHPQHHPALHAGGAARRTRPWSICSAASPSGRTRRPPRSRSPGCWPRSRGSCRSPARRSWSAWRRTSAPLPSSSPPDDLREIERAAARGPEGARYPRRSSG